MAEEQHNGAETAVTADSAEPQTEVATTTEEVKAEAIATQDIRPGMTVRVHQKIKETTPKGEERERIQVFEGIVLACKGKDKHSATITVRKIASGVGVERIFPLRLPTIAKIEVMKALKVRRSKLYFLRTHKKRLKERSTK